jgi:hypothetical protein
MTWTLVKELSRGHTRWVQTDKREGWRGSRMGREAIKRFRRRGGLGWRASRDSHVDRAFHRKRGLVCSLWLELHIVRGSLRREQERHAAASCVVVQTVRPRRVVTRDTPPMLFVRSPQRGTPCPPR